MAWFRKHLNLMLVVTYLVLGLILFGIAFFNFWFTRHFTGNETFYILVSVLVLIIILANFLCIVLANAWVLKQKKRMMRWLWILLVPGGALVIILLKNHDDLGVRLST